jgi:3-methylcrotonyl-CoA carboxylase alpha subunit
MSPGEPALAGFRLNAPKQTLVCLTDRNDDYIADLATPVSCDQRAYPIVERDADRVFVTVQGATWRWEAWRKHGGGAAAAGDGALLAPMPGRIAAIDVAPGESVTKGQRLVTLEAMKMEHSLTAPFDGTIAELNAEPGAQVSEGTLLVRVEKAE